MSAVGHYLEQEGIPTAAISLVREHSEAMGPPRSLWVPFMLGRPLGAPHDTAFQRRVLLALLALFDAESGPVLQDFPDDAPNVESDTDEPGEGASCPVNFARPRPDASAGAERTVQLVDEIDELRPWHDLGVRRRGGTSGGLSGLTPEQAGRLLCDFADGRDAADGQSAPALARSLKLACDDLRTYFEEAAAAQPGGLSAQQMQDWFYLHTVAGQLLHDVRDRGLTHDDAAVRALCERMLIPRSDLNQRSRSAAAR